MTRQRFALLAVATITVSACTTKDVPKVDLAAKAASDSAALVLGGSAKVALDSGNALFRAKVYDAALTQYRRAAAEAPQHAAPLFGIYMVARATNNKTMADSAMAGIRARNAVPPHDLPDSAELRKIHAKVKTGTKAE